MLILNFFSVLQKLSVAALNTGGCDVQSPLKLLANQPCVVAAGRQQGDSANRI